MLRSHARRVSALALGVALLVLAAPAVALARTQTATSGAVTATFTFTTTSHFTYPTKSLTISRAGQVVYDQPVSSSFCGPAGQAQAYCAPGAPEAGQSSVHVLDLEPGGEPEVVLDLFTGGAHCCSVEQVFSFDPGTGIYAMSQHDFGDPGERIADLGHNGRLEFLTADDTFAYAFTAYAVSGLPIEILTFANGQFTNVTRQYPKLIAKDAAAYFKLFEQHVGDGVGVLAAWAADEDNLGHEALVSATLAKEQKAGDLRNPGGLAGKRFIRALNKLLKRDGYVN